MNQDLIVAAAALEEGAVNVDTHFYCGGFVRDIPGVVLKCARWYNPHGSQNFKEALENSCNVAFVDVGRRLGKEKLYEYIKAFGFGEPTGIELTGEQGGIIPVNTDVIKEVNLATMSYGHGIAVTPIQLLTAVSAIANGGKLMVPRVVSKLVDNEGNVVKTIEPVVKRQVISESTAKTLLELMEGVVSEGTGSNAYVPGYRVAGKTGTAQKIIDGRYAPGKYIGSFVAVAPADDPKIAVLVIVDEPEGVYYGGSVAAPVAGDLIEETLNYLDVPRKYTEEEKEKYENTQVVPDVRNKKIEEAGKILTDLGFRYTTESYDFNENSIVIEQFPLPGTEVTSGSIVDLYLDVDYMRDNKIVVPDVTGKTREEIINILKGIGLNYEFQGQGRAIDQDPKPGTEVEKNSTVKIKLSDTED
jgi:stage V sporulation protein D (sporulation-specific penicillin-binding protein)